MTAHTQVLVGTAAGVPARVRPRRPLASARTRDLLALLATGALVVGVVLSYVFQHIQVVRLGYEVERLRGERAALVEQGKVLTLEVGRLRAVKRVEEVARGELGMVTPAPGQIIVVR
ncbi:MAG TPA: cell division protein FtsL [Candidatus Methylomirabilis sp.]|jgi:cell division protein FtsL